MKRLTALLLVLTMALSLWACAADVPETVPTTQAPTEETTQPTTAPTEPAQVEIVPVDDNYRNWYEVFVYSYVDSDGDGIGDFNGLASKLEYIYDMGFNGIWLMPIMTSPSYHKYDVTDYYNTDSDYGTLEDFRSLLAKAHDLGIKVIIDLPVNHTSDQHPWFLDSRSGEDAEYRDYYVWNDGFKSGYTAWGSAYYESQFVSTMPDLNLDNEVVRQEIANIMAFWLSDVGVDGFRLDAVTSYYTGDEGKNIEMLTWIGQTARSIKEDCYIVAEAWTDLTTIGRYSEAQIDSFFTFSIAQQDGSIAKLLGNAAKTPGQTYGNVVTRLEETLAEHSIAAPFLGNHDTARPANFLGRSQVAKLKMAAGLLAMLPGNPFVYYGEEIGMLGKDDDPNKRIGMLWTTEEETTTAPPGTTKIEYNLPGVEDQLADEDSLLNYYKAAMWLRHKYPEIARGTTEVVECENTDICILRRTWNGSTITIVLNPSLNDHTVEVEGALSDTLSATGAEITQDGTTLTMPSYSIAILK